jgi:PAS domain S-box-containing protein
MFNAGAEKLLGYSSIEMVGRHTPIVLHDPVEIHSRKSTSGCAEKDWAVVVQPSMLNKPQEWNYVCKDGRRVTVSQIVVPMRSQAGEPLGFVCVAQNISRQKQYEESLRETTRRAEQASRAKTQFLANMSHEMRTPMNAVVGLSFLLGQTSMNEEQKSFLDKITVASKALLAIINDVLDVSKIEAGELIVERAAFSPRDLLKQVSDTMAVPAQAKGIAFRVEVQEDLPAILEGDSKHLRQILTNLLSNAIRFTERGSVVVRVNRVDVDSPGVTVCFIVQDTGIGISPEAQERIFAPFSQADASITRRFGGTGLGLSIVKSLVHLMGGELELISSPGVGSEFKVVINFVEREQSTPTDSEADEIHLKARALQGVRVLIVDDSDINLDVTRRILEMSGAQVGLAMNGLEAFHKLEAQPDDFDVVLMDVQMPVLDGYAATQRIRVELALVDLPIIALTAGALSSERQRALESGMDDFVIKPFDAPMLTRSILRHIRGASLQGSTPIDAAALGRAVLQTPWPVIDGVDSTLSRSRLVNDPSLLRSVLRRLLSDFSSIEISETETDAASLAAHAQRMHKLKGNAGMLGAKEIHELAGKAERACQAGEIILASRLARAITDLLERLRISAAPILEERAQPQPGPNTEEICVDIEPAQIDNFIQSLRLQSINALETFKALSPQLQWLVGEDCFRELSAHMDNLDFGKAVEALEGHQRSRRSMQCQSAKHPQ